MRLNRPLGVASNPEPARGHRAGAGVVRTLSVTALAAAACALSALPALASSSAPSRTTTVNSPAKVPSKTTVSVSPTTAKPHTSVKLSVTVTASGTTPTGTVTIWVSTRELCAGTLSDGKYSCEEGFPNPGPKTIVGKYKGNGTVAASTGTAKLTIT
jgi:hypothetical protein